MPNSNLKPTELKWLEEGYRQFAIYGPENLSIKKISEKTGSSRASFYHYFGDIDVFIEHLLAMHWNIAKDFNQKGKLICKNLFPDLYIHLSENPTPLQFSIQLFHHRDKPAYNYLFMKTYEASAKTFILKLFAIQFSLQLPENEVYNLWLTVGEAWYSRLNSNDLSSYTLQKHAEEIMNTVLKFSNTQLYLVMKKQNKY